MSGLISPVRSAVGTNAVGRHQPALGVLPAHQRLDPAHLTGHQVELGLVVQHQLPLVERHPQLAEQLQLLSAVMVVLGRIDGQSAVPVLRLGHRDVGVPEHRLGVHVLSVAARSAGSRARPALTSMARDRPATSNGAAQGLAYRLRRRPSVALARRHRRISTANSSPPRRATVSPSAASCVEAAAHRRDELVAVRVPERVVDLAEPVDVEQQQGARLRFEQGNARCGPSSRLRFGSSVRPSWAAS